MSRVPIVDTVLACDCPISGKTTLLVARNALFVQSMNHNLIPPFIMREAGLKVEEQVRIHVKEPAKEDHSIYSSEINLRITLQLEGTFLVFKTRNLNDEEIAEPGGYGILYLTPDADSWDPNCEAWAKQEDEMLYVDGEILLRTQRPPIRRLYPE